MIYKRDFNFDGHNFKNMGCLKWNILISAVKIVHPVTFPVIKQPFSSKTSSKKISK